MRQWLPAIRLGQVDEREMRHVSRKNRAQTSRLKSAVFRGFAPTAVEGCDNLLGSLAG